jgi:hypothetical protein
MRSGCLMMILAMAWDVIDGSGTYLVPWIPRCREAVSALAGRAEGPPEKPVAALCAAVLRALERADAGGRGDAALEADAVWANRTFVAAYFEAHARELAEAHRRFCDRGPQGS